MLENLAPVLVDRDELHELSWARTADVLIVGSGAAACLAALATARNGGTALLLEKSAQPGGNTGRSNGTFWIPNNRLLRSLGRLDDKPRLMAYMARVTWPDVFDPTAPDFGLLPLAYRKLEAFFDDASGVLDVLVDEEHAFDVMFRQTWEGRPYPDTMARLPDEADQWGHSLNVDMRHDRDKAFHQSGGGNGTQLISGLQRVLRNTRLTRLQSTVYDGSSSCPTVQSSDWRRTHRGARAVSWRAARSSLPVAASPGIPISSGAS